MNVLPEDVRVASSLPPSGPCSGVLFSGSVSLNIAYKALTLAFTLSGVKSFEQKNNYLSDLQF